MVAALRAGASLIAVPSTLRDAEAERALRRMPALAAAVRWLRPGRPRARGEPDAWLLLPASSLIHVSALAGLLATPAPRCAVLAPSAGGPAPVALVPAPLVAELWTDLAAGRPVGALLTRRLVEAAEPREATGPYAAVRDTADLVRAEKALEATLGIAVDSGVDRYLHRRGSRVDQPAPGAHAGGAESREPREPGDRPGRDLVLLARDRRERPAGRGGVRARLHRGPCRRRDRPADIPGVTPGGQPRLDDRHDHPRRASCSASASARGDG